MSSYALAAQRHMHADGLTSEQLASIAVTTRNHAARNPLAMYRDPITVEDLTFWVRAPCQTIAQTALLRGHHGGGAGSGCGYAGRNPPHTSRCGIPGASHSSDHQIESRSPDAGSDPHRRGHHRSAVRWRITGITPDDVEFADSTDDSFTITVLLRLEIWVLC